MIYGSAGKPQELKRGDKAPVEFKKKKKQPDTKSTEPRVYTELFQRATSGLDFFFFFSRHQVLQTRDGLGRVRLLPSRIYSEISQKAALNNKTQGAAAGGSGEHREDLCCSGQAANGARLPRSRSPTNGSRGTPGTLRNGCDERASEQAMLLHPPRTLNTHEK